MQGVDFKLGYSPERINPGDRDHKFESIVKVVAGEDEETADLLSTLYGRVVTAGVHVAPSIKVAECAKVLENSQRDINVALMNELAIICDLLNIRTRDVLDAAVTKWNFLKFSPGLVGGHCIGVDPYYLTAKAIELGYHPEVILSGRRVNDSMGPRIAQRLVKLLAQSSLPLSKTRVGILGLTFKENVPDIRNSRVPDIIDELRQFGISVEIVDPHVDPTDALRKFGFTMTTIDQLDDLDALVLAVPHEVFLDKKRSLMSRLKRGGVLIDIKSVFAQSEVPPDIRHWSL
jgi:UDP-N-acetyl-D-galactosamine dehydrogenase